MIKNTTVLVTNLCNSKCSMCNIWKKGITDSELCPSGFKKIFELPEFKELEDLNISGGEALLREDLFEIIEGIIQEKDKIHMLFLSTNGTNPIKAKKFVSRFSQRIKDVYICVSIDGDRETNLKVRGIDSYESAIKTIEYCREANDNIHTIISATLTPINCNLDTLHFIQKLAEKTGSTYSFRRGWVNSSYYRNSEKDLNISSERLSVVSRFMERYCMDDPFMRLQLEFFKTGLIPLMGSKEGGIKCRAGDIFVLIKPDGTIFPCINSTRKIGNLERGIFIKDIKNLGKFEQCPCCTECCIWPMINFSHF